VNDRKAIAPKELDIFFEDKKIAVEINGIYFHNDVVKDKNYHVEKTVLCERAGIRLFHFWDFEVLD
jgi:very-short-patch-repair endonuclease